MDLTKETSVAFGAVRDAMNYCLHVQQSLITSSLAKDDRSPVTIADFGAQAIICRAIQKAFPNDSILAEEHATQVMRDGEMGRQLVAAIHAGYDPVTAPDLETICSWIDAGRGDSAARQWIVDPVDGTKGFLRREQYAIALALRIDGQIKVGVLGCPNLPAHNGQIGCTFYATARGGAVEMPLGGEPRSLRVSRDAELVLAESVESGHTDHDRHAAIAARLKITRPSIRMDSQAKYAIVARGDASAYLRLPNPKTPDYRENVWDHAAGYLIITEAGGRVTDAAGKDLDFSQGPKLINNRGIVATNGHCHTAVLEAVARASCP
ncbi:MAG: 3'(2'),5'-bisphosphate nucleotidase [Planctomycetaceae bacterium]|nr:3'(2'),5'-bisphosphate nucleotidase [Planctomycetaceae bacterium]